jgi:hypothetical protein
MGQYSRQTGPMKQKQTEIQKKNPGFNSGAFLPKQTTWSQYFKRRPENSHASHQIISTRDSQFKIPVWGWVRRPEFKPCGFSTTDSR